MYLLSKSKQVKSMEIEEGDSQNIVNEKMNAKGIQWALAKVKGHHQTSSGHKMYIFGRKFTGCYVVILGGEIGFATHFVAIDCDRCLLYNCMEIYVLLLNRKNLNHCLGLYSNRIKCIPQCIWIQEQPRK